LLLVAIAAAALVLGAGSGGSAGVAACKGTELHGAFTLAPGSAGAGNIVYKLRIRNQTAADCSFPTYPILRLQDRAHHPLPTHATFPRSHATSITIAPHHAAIAQARFSPDIPSGGEPASGPCEPIAAHLHVGLLHGAGSITVPVQPATRVCGHGSMSFHAIHLGA